jgi:hypothetical protein
MTGYLLPLTQDSWQVMTLDVIIDEEEFHAQVEIRHLPAPDQWVVSIWDHSSSELLVNMIPLVCSYGEVNDLLAPFRYLRNGKGLGTMICLRGTDEPSTPDPTGSDLNEFQLYWGDTYV